MPLSLGWQSVGFSPFHLPFACCSSDFVTMNSTGVYLNKPVRDLARFYPEQGSIWMYAMVAIGCAFILFVVITMSIICKSTIKQWKTEQSNEMRQIPMRNFGSTSFLQFEEEISVSRLNVNYEF